MSLCFLFVPWNVILIFSDMGIFASPVKEWKSGWTEKRKSSPAINQAWREETDKASCKINRKHYVSPGHTAVVKYHNDSVFEILTAFLPRKCSLTHFAIFITGDTQLLNYPPFLVTPSLQLIPDSPNLTSETATIPEFSPSLPQNPSLVLNPFFTRGLFSLFPIASQPLLWNSLALLSK